MISSQVYLTKKKRTRYKFGNAQIIKATSVQEEIINYKML